MFRRCALNPSLGVSPVSVVGGRCREPGAKALPTGSQTAQLSGNLYPKAAKGFWMIQESPLHPSYCQRRPTVRKFEEYNAAEEGPEEVPTDRAAALDAGKN